MGLGTRILRLTLLEQHSATQAGLLTERTRRQLQSARKRGQHVQSEHPGELVCLDTFYIGKLKGVGKVWQITACDTASSYAVARILPVNNASHAAGFLRGLATAFHKAGWPIQRVLTDNGSEFKADFDQACDELEVKHTRTKPRHAWTNGFVERLQGTILHEHWRIAFRRRYFTTRKQLQQSLQRFLTYYNDERPHFGYRTRGRRPSDIFWGAKGRT
jgi:transposase InsO family protein